MLPLPQICRSQHEHVEIHDWMTEVVSDPTDYY